MTNIDTNDIQVLDNLWIDLCRPTSSQLILKKYDKKTINKEKYLKELSSNKQPHRIALLQQLFLFSPEQVDNFLSFPYQTKQISTQNYINYFIDFYFAIEPFKEKYDQVLKLVSGNDLLLGTLFILSSRQNNKSLLSKIKKLYSKNNFSQAISQYIKYYNNQASRYDFYHHSPNFYLSILKNSSIKNTLEKYDQFAIIANHQDSLYWGHPDQGHSHSIVSILNDFSFSPFNPPLYRIFKQAGFNLNSQNRFGNTPAHLMLDQLSKGGDSLIFIQLLELIKAGADLTVKNSRNKSFIDIWFSSSFRKSIKHHLEDNQSWDTETPAPADFILESNLAIGAIDAILEKQQIANKLSSQKFLKTTTLKNKI